MNARPCGLCKNLDSRLNARGLAYCWFHYRWMNPEGVAVLCEHYTRPDGDPPEGRLTYEGEAC